MTEICRVVDEAKYTARVQREMASNKAQPWIVLKLMVFITAGIMAYAGYVYIGRFCVNIILGKRDGVTEGTGVALLTIFCILYIWMWWSYARVVLTPPGFARDYVTQSAPPMLPAIPVSPNQPNQLDQDSFSGPSYEEMSEAYTNGNAGIPRPILPHTTQGDLPNGKEKHTRADQDLQRAASRNVTRRPPTTPALAPEYRYCSRDLFLKPYRAHHCRACGTCVLKYDHHCPWIGQCVGARNHKFFVNFNLATALFTVYTFSTLVAYTVRASNNNDDIDPQQLVIIALAGLFCLFTTTLFVSHTRLLCLSQTTVENLHHHSIKEREDHMLTDVFACYQVSSKQRVRKEWDKDWGRIGKEGNVWWLGSALKGWEETMGSGRRTLENRYGWLSWVFPLGLNKKEVGLHYEVNPRFDAEGRWRRRSEWPENLR